jgi:DamX protein
MSEEVQVLPEKAEANRVIFKPEAWLATVDFVKRLVLENNVMMAILGEQGNGKTTFAHLLHAELSPYIKPYIIPANPLFNRVFFLQQLKELLGVEGEPSISNFIAHCKEQESHTLIIIDDAQHLSAVFVEEVLGEMQQLGDTSYFHVCLVSDFSLVPVLNKLAQHDYQDRIHSIELGALTESETKTYLLQHVMPRQNVEKRVTDVRVKQFYQLTAGHLVDINRQMARFFSVKAAAPKSNKFFGPLNIAVSVALIAVAAYIWGPEYSRSMPMAILEQTMPSPSEMDENDMLLSQIEPVLYSIIPSFETEAVRQAILATPLRRNELVAFNEEDEVVDESEAVLDKVIVAPKVIAHEEMPVVQPAPAAPKLVKKSAIIKPIVEQGRYTIQLLASKNKKELERFANVHHLKGKVQLRLSQRQGEAWYVLTLGEYQERQHATQAVTNLPKDIVQFKPWVRAISDLKIAG